MDHRLVDENNNEISQNSLENRNYMTNDNSLFSRHRQSKKTVFDFDSNELYELFLNHGIPDRLCDLFLKNTIDGSVFSSMWIPGEDYKEFGAKLNKKIQDIMLTDYESRHLFSILKKYKICPYNSKHKLIADNVHGQINVHPLLIKIIDTPQFQRLRYLKQLGTLCYVYPTGNHSRFEHCIGTSHIAGLFIEHMKKSQPALKISLADELCVRIAGLCHDLGHGPFSHMFEEVIEMISPNTSWQHEMATLMLFDKMLTENDHLKEEFHSYGLFEMDIQLIKDLIYAPVFKSADVDPNATYSKKLLTLESLQYRGTNKSFLFEIISNYRNGIDVDKFDYFERDCMQMGFKNNFNYKRYIACTRVIKDEDGINQICCRDKDIQDLYEMFHVRELLTRRAYKHETGSSINLMIVDALVKAEKYFNFKTMIETKDIDRFEKLNDNIFLEVLYSNDERLEESKKILERVGKRKLYKYVGSTVLPNDKNTRDSTKNLKADLIHYLAASSKNEINKENTEIEIARFNYGSKNKNPMENVKCYNKYAPNYAFKIEKNQISGMLLNQFEDAVIRVYSKKSDDYEFFDRVHEQFYFWCKSRDLASPLYGMNIIDN